MPKIFMPDFGEIEVDIYGRPLPIEPGKYGYYTANGRQVPRQPSGVPFIGMKCAACDSPIEFPVEYGGELFCDEVCARELHPNDPHMPQYPEEVWEQARHRKNLKAEYRRILKEAEDSGVALQ